jgi:hypothetical protein
MEVLCSRLKYVKKQLFFAGRKIQRRGLKEDRKNLKSPISTTQNPYLRSHFMRPIQELYPQLAEPRNVAVTMHQKPDADAMGASLALALFLRQLGHKCYGHFTDKLGQMAQLDARVQ